MGCVGEEGGEACGGAEKDFRDFRAPILFREPLVRIEAGRRGEESSAPDWKILLSSQPLSSPYKTDDQLAECNTTGEGILYTHIGDAASLSTRIALYGKSKEISSKEDIFFIPFS